MRSNQQKTETFKTILIITIGFIVLGLIFKYKWITYFAISIGCISLISATAAKKIEYLWYKLARLLSFIVPNILLSAIFYLLLTPIAILYRIFGDTNALGLKNDNISQFRDTNKHFEKQSFENPW